MGDNRQNDNTNKRHKFLNGFLCLLAICFLNIIFGDGLRAQSGAQKKQQLKPAAKTEKVKPTIPTAYRYQK